MTKASDLLLLLRAVRKGETQKETPKRRKGSIVSREDKRSQNKKRPSIDFQASQGSLIG